MKMKSMKLSPEDHAPQKGLREMPSYPYGLALSLDHQCLKKLKMKELPEVGEKMMLHAMVEVVSVSQHDSAYGGENQSVGLQITELSLEEADEATEEKLYGEKA